VLSQYTSTPDALQLLQLLLPQALPEEEEEKEEELEDAAVAADSAEAAWPAPAPEEEEELAELAPDSEEEAEGAAAEAEEDTAPREASSTQNTAAQGSRLRILRGGLTCSCRVEQLGQAKEGVEGCTEALGRAGQMLQLPECCTAALLLPCL
jgi:hypothetical protein